MDAPEDRSKALNEYMSSGFAPRADIVAACRHVRFVPRGDAKPIKDWSLTTMKDKLIKIGAKVVSHGRYVIFQMAEVAIAPQMFQEILRLIAELRPQPPPALA